MLQLKNIDNIFYEKTINDNKSEKLQKFRALLPEKSEEELLTLLEVIK